MKLINKGRGEGKSFDLTKLSAETGIPIVSTDVFGVINNAEKLGISIPKPIRLSDFLEMENKPETVYVDEIGFVLQKLLGAKVAVGTITDDEMLKTWFKKQIVQYAVEGDSVLLPLYVDLLKKADEKDN